MDNQSLLSGDAIERYMGMPLTHVPAPEGSPHPNYARHFATLFLETFADLGIHPTLYWMSEQYGSGAMDPYIQRALDDAEVILEIYRTVSTVQHPEGWLPISVICENCGKIGTTAARDWDGREVVLHLPRRPRHVGQRLRPRRPGSALRWPRQDGLERRLGRPLGIGRRDDRGLRQGPRHRRRFTRSRGRDQPARLRARAAPQHPVRVPEHRRAQDEHVEGSRCRGTRSRCAPATDDLALPVPALSAQPRDQLRSEWRLGTASLRRVRPHRRRGRGQAPARRAAARPGAHLRAVIARRCRRPDGRGRALPATFLLTSRCFCRCPGRTSWSASRSRRARRSTTRRRTSRSSGSLLHRPGWPTSPPTRRAWRSSTTDCRLPQPTHV